jgi:hypothetical protein
MRWPDTLFELTVGSLWRLRRMATMRQLLERLAQGAVTLEQVVSDFQTRVWPVPRASTDPEMYGMADAPLVDDDSVDWVDITPGLTDQQRAILRAAYDQAVLRAR